MDANLLRLVLQQQQRQAAAARQAIAPRFAGPLPAPLPQTPNVNNEAALRAVIDGLQSAGPLDDAMEPPEVRKQLQPKNILGPALTLCFFY